MSPSNAAAWLTAKSTNPLEVKEAPYTSPRSGEIVIRNRAVAINPVDWGKQLVGNLILSYIKYPFIPGCDVAGEVVELGPDTSRFRVGDRVLGSAIGGAIEANRAAEGAFQRYTVLREHLACPMPEAMSYEQACVMPVGAMTAAHGLFHRDFLNLDFPTVPPRPNPTGRAVIITAGASSVGSNAIQLAVAAGYEVYSTCSAKNSDYVRGLGATRVFDYRRANWADEMARELRGKPVAGAYTIGDGAAEACTQILRRLSRANGTKGKNLVSTSIANAGSIPPADQLKSSIGMAKFMSSAIFSLGRTAVTSAFTGIKPKFIEVDGLPKPDCVVGRVYTEFLPQALATKQFVPAPDAQVVGKGLEKVQEAMDIQAKGVSARKVVVSL